MVGEVSNSSALSSVIETCLDVIYATTPYIKHVWFQRHQDADPEVWVDSRNAREEVKPLALCIVLHSLLAARMLYQISEWLL